MILCSVCFGFTNISNIAKGLPDFCCQICIHNNVNGQGTLYMQSWEGNLGFYLGTQHVKRNYIDRDLIVFLRKKLHWTFKQNMLQQKNAWSILQKVGKMLKTA